MCGKLNYLTDFTLWALLYICIYKISWFEIWIGWVDYSEVELCRTEQHGTEKLFQIHVFVHPFAYLKFIEALLCPDIVLGVVYKYELHSACPPEASEPLGKAVVKQKWRMGSSMIEECDVEGAHWRTLH